MSHLLSGFQKLSLLSSRASAPESVTVEPASLSSTVVSTRFERFRSHPDLIEVVTDAPTTNRIRFHSGADSERRVLGEMPRGLSFFFLRLAGPLDEILTLEWHPFGEESRRVVFAGGEPLQPRMTLGTRVRVHWRATEYPLLRISGYRWANDGGFSHPLSVGFPEITQSPLGSWLIPSDWLGPEPLELRLTPFSEDSQGLTERLIVPPRRLRVETVFRRVMLPVNGRHWRRLRIETRVPPPLSPPSAIMIDWKPYDSGVSPRSFRREWPKEETVVTIDLENISLRGDRVEVGFESTNDTPQSHAWLATEESGHYAIPPADVLLAEGDGPEDSTFVYTHANTFPNGERANVLTDDQPLLDIPGLSEAVPDRGDWPPTFVAAYRAVAADQSVWKILKALPGVVEPGIGEFARAPQIYLQYANEPDLRAIASRCGIGQSPFFVEEFKQALASDRNPTTDDAALIEHLNASGDIELDRWLSAVAAGASVGLLQNFWLERKWNEVAPAQVMEASCQIEEASCEPLSKLVPEVIDGTALARELNKAVSQESRLSSAAFEEFARIAQSRETVLAALAEHWRQLLPDHTDARCLRIGELLRSSPAEAARELAELRRCNDPVVLKHGRWPVFEAERELASVDLKHRQDRALRYRVSLHWCRTLLERRLIPAWPWHGVAPANEGAEALVALWETIRPGLPEASANMPELPDPLRKGLDELAAIARERDDDQLGSLAASLDEQAHAITLWSQ